MRFAVAVTSAFLATTVSAASTILRRQYPDCTAPCLQDVDYHGCSPTSITCLCNNDDYVQETTTCFVDACQGDELQSALDVANGLCASVGVTLQSSELLPPTSTGSGGVQETGSTSATTTGADSASTSETTTEDNSDGAMSLTLNGMTVSALAGVGMVALLL